MKEVISIQQDEASGEVEIVDLRSGQRVRLSSWDMTFSRDPETDEAASEEAGFLAYRPGSKVAFSVNGIVKTSER